MKNKQAAALKSMNGTEAHKSPSLTAEDFKSPLLAQAR